MADLNERGNQAERSAVSQAAATESERWTALTRPLDRHLGKRTANALAKMGIHTVGDLLAHVPFRLARRGELLPIQAIRDGDSVTVIARVLDASVRPMNRRRGYILNVLISDGQHNLEIAFFAKSSRPLNFHASKLRPGTLATFSGTISSYRGQLQLTHPEYEVVDDPDSVDPEKIAEPIPIYHASSAIPSWKIHKAIQVVLQAVTEDDLPDPLPATYRADHGLPSRFEALHMAHQPRSESDWHVAVERFKHEEAFVLQALLAQRAAAAQAIPAPALPIPNEAGLLAAFDSRLPFELTKGQREVGDELAAELASTTPMRRLLQGDVGSGKTIVALRAMLQAVDAGRQTVLVAPTEVLAAQHYATFTALLGNLATAGQLGAADNATRMELLTGSLSQAKKRQTLANIASGAAGIIIGTHALFEDAVQIPFLGLVVIDEQHRFGVDQRDRLADGAHMLVMTATPIPRTIAMTSFGELQVSTLKELPAGRQKIATTLVPAHNRVWMNRVWQRAREEVEAGGRVYVVAPRISAHEQEDDGARPGDTQSRQAVQEQQAEQPAFDLSQSAPDTSQGDGSQLASVEQVYQQLCANPDLDGVAIGYVHGQLPPEEKASAMAAFASGATPILVATTVIEVGVDVPEATMMVIMDAERFGLSQLHQLRGRVGRGAKEAICLAVHNAPDGTLASERLKAFASTTNGFLLAQRDLELRKEGNVLGTAQSGRASALKFVRVTKDEEIIEQARAAARETLQADPQLANHSALRAAIADAEGDETDYLEKA
ncbi:ATP-dependent DNA helicase RecG [Trueperella bialowiezensis]|uniref:Probable DNA 3'-5' helicase RecG n=1 Tax=Trueperella bialowiezensis TaxID=312285 RepID=A0A448PGJ2_9ACTO|nr:ATP-dependent DNA helicase RecG [Trueperella bialowiezensis]VEI14032.1 ATP-dependent DNA helicase recG [Trueperella bialowiezensis]